MRQSLYHLKQAWASLRLKPGFVATVVTTMGTTLGALLCVLTLAYLLILKPLPYPQQESLYTVEHQLINDSNQIDGHAFTYPNLMYLYDKQTVFSQIALMYHDADILLSSDSQPTLPISFVTPSWFSLLGAKMALGRSFEATESLNTYHPVAVISYATWQQQFSLDKDILSKTLRFGGRSYPIIGVLSQDFIEPQLAGVGIQSQVFLPWDFNSISSDERQKWGNDDDSLIFFGQFENSLNAQQAQQKLSTLVNDNWQQHVAGHAFFKGWRIDLKLHTLQSVLLADSENTIYLLILGVLGLVLIASTNIANLFISRTAEKRRELAIRATLGATKQHLFKTMLTETMLLMGLSVVIALYIASLGFTLLKHFLYDYLPRVDELTMQPITLLLAIMLVLGLALLFSYLSIRTIKYRDLRLALQSSGKGTGVQVSKTVRQALIFCQIAVVTALVFINIILFKQALATITESSGFETDNISWLVISSSANADQGKLNVDMLELKSRLRELPQISSVSQSMAPMPFFSLALSRLGGDERYSIKAKDVDDQYFQLIEQPMLKGNYFSTVDIQDQNNVIIVNDVFAEQLAPQGEALGLIFDNGAKIIGVVKGIKVPGDTDIPPRFYYPASATRNMFLLKTKPGQDISREQIIKLVNDVASNLRLFSLTTLNERRNERLFSQYTTVVASAVLAIVSFLLAAIGLYGILSYGTQMRRFEIGTRMALGAKRKQIIALIIKDNAWVIALGMATSMIVMLALYIAHKAQLAPYLGVGLLAIFAITVVAIGLLSLFACYWPLRQYINQPAINSLRGSD